MRVLSKNIAGLVLLELEKAFAIEYCDALGFRIEFITK